MVEEMHYGGFVQRDRKGPKSPTAPGASRSPQRPGLTPDRSSIPGHALEASPPTAGTLRRPLTQYGTAQEIMNTMPTPEEDADPTDFEQAPAALQEQRKAYPWQVPPVRPTSLFALDQGVVTEPPALPGDEAAALAASSGVEG
ncbi:hypothetical protein BH23CHL5_BH23CHL5_07230 [soil metagenome]